MQTTIGKPTYAGISWIRETDYKAFLSVIDDPETFPATYRAWLLKANKQVSDAKRLGFMVVRIVIDPKTFPDWCRARSLNVDAEARKRFAQEEARRKVTAL